MKPYTPQTFVEENLPDFLLKKSAWTEDNPITTANWMKVRDEFYAHYFPEAMEAYSRKLWEKACSEQKAICQGVVIESYDRGLESTAFKVGHVAPSSEFNIEKE